MKFMLQRRGAGLFADPGLGKTSTSLAVFKVLQENDQIDFMVVVAPVLVCYNTWPDEIKKWKDFEHFKYEILHHDGANASEVRSTNIKKKADIYVINPEGLEWLHDNWPKVWNKKRLMLVIDESTKFKSKNSIRFKIMRGSKVKRVLNNKTVEKQFKCLLKKFDRRYILTGTPAPNGLIDLFSQMYLVDMGQRLGKFLSHYQSKWFDASGYGNYTMKPKPDASEGIKDAIKDVVIRLEDKDYLDMPPLIGDIAGIAGKPAINGEGIIELELPPKIRKLYDELEEEFIIELDNNIITAQTAAASSTKLRQMANGGIYFNNKYADDPAKTLKREFKNLHLLKAEMTRDLVEQLSGQPVLIAYEFHHDLARLKKVLGKKTPHIGYGVTARESTRILTAWNKGDIPYLLGQPQSMSHGLNMQECGRAVIWHSMIWNYEHYVQLIRRLYRQGQKNPVFLYHIMMKNTVDLAVMYALKSKALTETKFLSALKQYIDIRKAA